MEDDADVDGTGDDEKNGMVGYYTNTTDIARQYIIRIRVEDGFHFHFQTSKSDVLLNV